MLTSDLTLEQLLDSTIDARLKLSQIDAEICRRLGCELNDGSDTADRVMSAVYDGQGWSELMRSARIAGYA